MMELHIAGLKLCPCPQPAGPPLEVAVAIVHDQGDLLKSPVVGCPRSGSCDVGESASVSYTASCRSPHVAASCQE
jgi:hypothetical protein